MMVALASVPQVAATHRKYGLPPEHLAKTFSWFRPMIGLYERGELPVDGCAWVKVDGNFTLKSPSAARRRRWRRRRRATRSSAAGT